MKWALLIVDNVNKIVINKLKSKKKTHNNL